MGNIYVLFSLLQQSEFKGKREQHKTDKISHKAEDVKNSNYDIFFLIHGNTLFDGVLVTHVTYTYYYNNNSIYI